MNIKNYQTICLISIYFGKLPSYFELWLDSCRCNETINFLLFTDDRTKHNYPKNVKVINTTLEDIKEYIQKYFEFDIALEYAYKLCDYKPVYGYVFQDYIREYDFWGHCDLDTIFGDLREFLNDNILEDNDKIYATGHFTLYKNEKRINENFKELIDNKTGQPLYKEVFSNNGAYYFDEWAGVINLYDGNKYKMYQNRSVVADISIKYNNLLLSGLEENGNYIFNWYKENGRCKLYGIRLNRDKVGKQEFMYIHLQKRYMNVQVNHKDNFYIVPNKFIEIDKTNEQKVFEQYKRKKNIYRKEYINLRLKRVYQKVFKKGKKSI